MYISMNPQRVRILENRAHTAIPTLPGIAHVSRIKGCVGTPCNKGR